MPKFYRVFTGEVFRVWAEDESDAIQRFMEDGQFIEADTVAEEDESQIVGES